MGCEATHRGREREKTENAFSGFIPLVPRKGFSPHIPASRLFVLFHPTQATIPPPSKPHQIKQPLSKIAVNERALLTARLIILSLENNYGYIAAFGKDSLIGGLEIPFGIEALSDKRVMSERALYRDDSAELLVINARERAKSTKLTMAINIEDEKIDDSVQSDEDEETENKEENAVSVSEIAAINEENPELPDITKAGSENPDDDDDDDDEDDTPEARNVKTLNKSAVRVLPKFMRRPTPETPQGFVMENFRLFERRILLTAREMSLSGYMPKPDTVYMFLPQKMAFIADVMAHENPGLKWVNVADMSQKRGELALQGAQNFAPYKLPVF